MGGRMTVSAFASVKQDRAPAAPVLCVWLPPHSPRPGLLGNVPRAQQKVDGSSGLRRQSREFQCLQTNFLKPFMCVCPYGIPEGPGHGAVPASGGESVTRGAGGRWLIVPVLGQPQPGRVLVSREAEPERSVCQRLPWAAGRQSPFPPPPVSCDNQGGRRRAASFPSVFGWTPTKTQQQRQESKTKAGTAGLRGRGSAEGAGQRPHLPLL